MQHSRVNKITGLLFVLSITIFAACKKTEFIKEDAVPSPKVTGTALTAAFTEKWVDSWAASFLSTTVNGAVQAAPSFNNQTLRLNVFSKLGGTKVKVKLTNKFATNTLTLAAVHVALRS